MKRATIVSLKITYIEGEEEHEDEYGLRQFYAVFHTRRRPRPRYLRSMEGLTRESGRPDLLFLKKVL